MFYTFTKHESSDDIQCLSSGRTRWPQLSKQTCCRNHRRFISNGASRLGRANIATRSFSTATSHSFPKPFHSIEDHQSRFWSATSGSSDSLQHKVQIIPKRTSESVLFTTFHFKFHGSFHSDFHKASVESIHLERLGICKASGSIVEPEFDRSARTGGKGGRPAFDVILPSKGDPGNHASPWFLLRFEVLVHFSIFFCWNSSIVFFCRRNFM